MNNVMAFKILMTINFIIHVGSIVALTIYLGMVQWAEWKSIAHIVFCVFVLLRFWNSSFDIIALSFPD